jgi:hypothetical protein
MKSFLLTAILASLLASAPHWAAAATEGQAKPKPAAVPAKAQGKKEPPGAPVLEIDRVGRPGCDIKPVMTDDEIEKCRKAAYQR